MTALITVGLSAVAFGRNNTVPVFDPVSGNITQIYRPNFAKVDDAVFTLAGNTRTVSFTMGANIPSMSVDGMLFKSYINDGTILVYTHGAANIPNVPMSGGQVRLLRMSDLQPLATGTAIINGNMVTVVTTTLTAAPAESIPAKGLRLEWVEAAFADQAALNSLGAKVLEDQPKSFHWLEPQPAMWSSLYLFAGVAFSAQAPPADVAHFDQVKGQSPYSSLRDLKRKTRVPDNAKLREVSIVRRSGRPYLNIKMVSNAPIPKDQHVSIEMFLSRQSDPQGPQGALLIHLSGKPFQPDLEGKIRNGSALVWTEQYGLKRLQFPQDGSLFSVRLPDEGKDRWLLYSGFSRWIPNSSKHKHRPQSDDDLYSSVSAWNRPNGPVCSVAPSFEGMAQDDLPKLPKLSKLKP